MTTIFVLRERLTVASEGLESQLMAIADARYPVEGCADLAELQSRLLTVKRAVVVFSASTEPLTSLMESCRNVRSNVTFICLVDEERPLSTAEQELDCHFLRLPLDEFGLRTRLSSAVRQSELLLTLVDSAQVDEVTNLYNRHHYIQRLSEEISLSRRHLSPLCCVVVGVNLYQIYLDSYGYNFINALLRFLADKITGMVRHEDIIARIGDDEIAVLLARSTEKGAKVFTDRLVRHLNNAVFKYGTYEEEVSVCAGIAGYPLPDFAGGDADTVIRYARHALHQARATTDEDKKVQLFSEIRPAL